VRKALFQVHLWCGIAFALYIVAISISGSVLVYKDELMPRPRVAHAPFDARDCTPTRLIAAIHAANQLHPELEPNVASCPTQVVPVYAISLRPRGNTIADEPLPTVFLHPQTEAVVGHAGGGGWLLLVERFHEDLLLRRHGRLWNGAGAAVLLVLVLSGVVIWWPGQRNWRRAFTVNPRLSWKRINFDLHSAAGIWTILFTLTWALTGIYFAWPAPFEHAISSISPIRMARYPAEEIARITNRPSSPSARPIDLARVLGSAKAQSQDTALEGVYFGSGRAPILTVYMAQGRLGDYTRTDFLYFDQNNGQFLYAWRRGRNQTLGDWLLWLAVPLHFGTSFGPLGKLVWCALGLVPPLLVVTGATMYWSRWLSKRRLWITFRDAGRP
jgi:uncharacterized iron-regulated membrane protein